MTLKPLKLILLLTVLCSYELQGGWSKPSHIVPAHEDGRESDNEIAVELHEISETAEITEFPNAESANKPNQIPSENEFRAKYARKMITYMNQSVNPCDDFYEYACGNWRNVIQKRQAQHKRSNLLDIIYHLGDTATELLRKSADTLELDYAAELRLAQQFYQNCLEANLYPMQNSSDYLEAIKLMGGFPAVDDTWNADNFSWFNMSAELSNYGIASLVREEIMPEFPFPPYFKLPELGFDYIVQTDNIATNASRGYELNERRMRNYLTKYGVAEPKITQTIADIFEFWHAVLEVSEQFDGNAEQCNQQFSGTSLQEFERWDDYFAIAWLGKDFNLTDTKCPCDYFYVELDSICNKHKPAVANYMAMKFLYSMDARLKDVEFQEEYCIMNMQNTLPYLIDKLYLQDHFNQEIRVEVINIVQEIRKSLRTSLQEADWLDEATRVEALLKESTIDLRVGNFEDSEMTERLIRAMSKLTFVEGNYEQNNMNLKKFKMFMRRYNGLHHEQLKVDTKPLELLVAMQVNAFYYNVDNSINVMAGILHPPAYHKLWPNSLKFGTIGYLVGHELTHGFDSVGAMYDSAGNDRYWWSIKSGSVFNERANCYVDHYSSYVIPQINRTVNGNTTMDENIADGGGLREALNAYRRYVKELAKQVELSTLLKEEKMPGLNLSPEQLFFLGFAQLWCAAYEEEHFWEELSDAHTIDKYRVLGAVTNIEDFAKAYNCPLGSEMHPKVEKCRLW